MSRRLSRRLPRVLACLGAGWIILVAAAEYALPGDRVWLVGEQYDAGQVSAGVQIRHRVWLINPSLRRLQVQLQPTCGCTAVGLREGTLPPLGIRPVQLQVDTSWCWHKCRRVKTAFGLGTQAYRIGAGTRKTQVCVIATVFKT